MTWGTVELLEIIWTAAALPGLVWWAANRVTAGRSRKAVAALGLANGRALWARFSVLLTDVFVAIEAVFVVIGVIAMLRENPPGATTISRLIIAGGLILTSAMITLLAYRWREVDEQLVAMARSRRAKPPPDTGEGDDR